MPAAVYRMNHYDGYALEAALRLGDCIPDVRVDALSFGPPRVVAVIRRALEMGAREGIHLLSPEERYCFPREVAAAIARFVRTEPYDLICTGVMAEDDQQGQVGPMLAAMLGWVWATAVLTVDVAPDRTALLLARDVEGGWREVLTLPAPALVTFSSGPHPPRYPTLSHVLRARKQVLRTLAVSGDPSVEEELLAVAPPDPGISGIRLEGPPEQAARELWRWFRERGLL